MTTYNPTMVSPIVAPAAAPTGTGLQLADLTGTQVLHIQGDADPTLKNLFKALPQQPGEVVDVGVGYLARLTPAEVYLFGKVDPPALPAEGALDAEFQQAKAFAHATDLTHGTAAVKLSGAEAAAVLRKVCGLDFHDSAFPNMQVKQSSAAKIKTLIARIDEGDTPAYHLHVSRPLGQYFWDVVWDAGQEFGIGV